MNTTVLVLGDKSGCDSYIKICEQVEKYRQKKLNWVISTYDLLEKNEQPLIESDLLIIYLLFPFTYWDKEIEKEGYGGVYGNTGKANQGSLKRRKSGFIIVIIPERIQPTVPFPHRSANSKVFVASASQDRTIRRRHAFRRRIRPAERQ